MSVESYSACAYGFAPWCLLSSVVQLCDADLIWPSDVNGISHQFSMIAIKRVSSCLVYGPRLTVI